MKNVLPILLDITPSEITKTSFYVVETDDIKTPQDFEGLLTLMHEFSERKFYYYSEKDKPFNELFVGAERFGIIVYRKTEFFIISTQILTEITFASIAIRFGSIGSEMLSNENLCSCKRNWCSANGSDAGAM